MKVSAIVYTSATGFTARYAALLAQQTGLPCCPLDQAAGALERGTPVLYLGWLCAGSIKGLKRAHSRFSVQGICAVGMSPPDPAYTAKLARPDGLRDVPLFYLRGGYAPWKLTGVYKPMMAVMARAVTKAPPKNAQEAAMQDAFRQGGDWVDEAALAPVLNWVEQ